MKGIVPDINFQELGLAESATDREIWQFCQKAEAIITNQFPGFGSFPR
jgi:predicted nuclease of predicted toxin-antitoxin system